MFANKEKKSASLKEAGSEENNIDAFLGEGSAFEGRMVFKENMRIDGTFRGDISSNDLLVIGATAKLKADVIVGSLIVSGYFEGDIKANTRVELRAPAQVIGDIQAPVVSVETGVIFNGGISMK
jgi:cytoskeletal protein CcmA (bactofilin family)